MCGIAGIFDPNMAREQREWLAQQMCRTLRHRGPDASGTYLDGQVALGACRLAVVDIAGSRQPMANEDGSIVVVLNGEIYNFQELRSQLQRRGHRFQSAGDTEVIVHLYEEYGPDCVSHLHGMFAFAVWDVHRSRLMLARDRIGVKPLYYWHSPGQMVFGSEIKAILQHDQVPREVDLTSVDQMLAFGFVRCPRTAFKQIQQLPPAHYLLCTGTGISATEYWDLDDGMPDKHSDVSWVDRLDSRLDRAVSSRMVADVPLGVFLSGGIDSSLVAAYATKHSPETISTFSIGFSDDDYSELSIAREVAAHLKTRHHALVIEPDLESLLPSLIQAHDAPFYDSSAVPMYYLCQWAKEHVTVALSGDGGDELFAGYRTFVANQLANAARLIPSSVRRQWFAPWSRRVSETTGPVNRGRALREFWRGVELDPVARYARWSSKAKRETRQSFYRAPELLETLRVPDDDGFRDDYNRYPLASELARLQFCALKGELVGDLLVKVDRMSMAHSVEVRSPLLDSSLFEWAATIPDSQKIDRWRGKRILRDLARRHLPRSVVRQRKRGFMIPLDRWIRGRWANYVQSCLLDASTLARPYFHQGFIRRMVDDHMRSRANYGRELWTLLTFELWHRMYIDDKREGAAIYPVQASHQPISDQAMSTHREEPWR